MRAARLIALIALAMGGIAIALGGVAPLGRLALALGLPRLAVPLLHDPDWRGVALYRSGDMAGAAAAFAAGSGGLNLGLALVQEGRLTAALEALDLARPNDPRAAALHGLLMQHVAGVALDPASIYRFADRDSDAPAVPAPTGQGQGRAAGTGDGVTNTSPLPDLPELESRGRLGVRRVFDARHIAADERWLATLPDVPGDYLAARIEAERKRRRDLGLTPPPPEDPS